MKTTETTALSTPVRSTSITETCSFARAYFRPQSHIPPWLLKRLWAAPVQGLVSVCLWYRKVPWFAIILLWYQKVYLHQRMHFLMFTFRCIWPIHLSVTHTNGNRCWYESQVIFYTQFTCSNNNYVPLPPISFYPLPLFGSIYVFSTMCYSQYNIQ